MKRPCKCLFLWSLGGAREPSLVIKRVVYIAEDEKESNSTSSAVYIPYVGNVKDASSSKWRIDRETSHRIVS